MAASAMAEDRRAQVGAGRRGAMRRTMKPARCACMRGRHAWRTGPRAPPRPRWACGPGARVATATRPLPPPRRPAGIPAAQGRRREPQRAVVAGVHRPRLRCAHARAPALLLSSGAPAQPALLPAPSALPPQPLCAPRAGRARHAGQHAAPPPPMVRTHTNKTHPRAAAPRRHARAAAAHWRRMEQRRVLRQQANDGAARQGRGGACMGQGGQGRSVCGGGGRLAGAGGLGEEVRSAQCTVRSARQAAARPRLRHPAPRRNVRGAAARRSSAGGRMAPGRPTPRAPGLPHP